MGNNSTGSLTTVAVGYNALLDANTTGSEQHSRRFSDALGCEYYWDT